MEYPLTLRSDRKDIAIMRVENGWLIRTNDHMAMGFVTPLQVAETPKALVAIVARWALSQEGVTPPEPDETAAGP